MGRPFRTTPLRPFLGEWLFWMLFAAAIAAIVLLVCWCDDQAKLDCERKGGQSALMAPMAALNPSTQVRECSSEPMRPFCFSRCVSMRSRDRFCSLRI